MSRMISVVLLVLCTVYTSNGSISPPTPRPSSECDGHPVGRAFRPNRCTVCRCDYYGKKHCVPICCKPPLHCKKLYIPPGKCCPICQVCYFGLKVLQHGGTAQPNPCVFCKCYNGYLDCHVTQCNLHGSGILTCQNPKYIDGQCCPVCEVGKDEMCAAKGGFCLSQKNPNYYGYRYTLGKCDDNKVCVFVPGYGIITRINLSPDGIQIAAANSTQPVLNVTGPPE